MQMRCYFCPGSLKNPTDPFLRILKIVFAVMRKRLLREAVGVCNHVNSLSRSWNGNARLQIFKDKLSWKGDSYYEGCDEGLYSLLSFVVTSKWNWWHNSKAAVAPANPDRLIIRLEEELVRYSIWHQKVGSRVKGNLCVLLPNVRGH